MFFAILVMTIYLGFIFHFSGCAKRAIVRTLTRENSIPTKDVIVKASLSKKASSYWSTMLIVALFLWGILLIYAMAGSDEIASAMGIDNIVSLLIYVFCWFGFLYTAVLSVYYSWVHLGTVGQLLVVTNEKVVGSVSLIKGLNIKENDFEVSISNITDIVSIKGERILGIDLSTFKIITEEGAYEYIMLVDGKEIKNIIEEKRLKIMKE